MNGCIRLFLGLFLVFGSVGGIENGTDSNLLVQIALAAIGLIIMHSGAKCFIGVNNE